MRSAAGHRAPIEQAALGIYVVALLPCPLSDRRVGVVLRQWAVALDVRCSLSKAAVRGV